ncbi:glucanase B [Bombardia bombarda]|uniref:Glucanase B n=1 Tax=Bombardia bombarda TaxID=252184 RepID=A0AA39WU29_9PEZI|nr:glucanase B [Bombardia bombarda]
MATLEEVLGAQKRHGILQAPTTSTLNISLQNNTTSSNVWAYITGLDINKNNAVFLLQSDGKTGYYPQSPASTQSPLLQNCHIQLGAPGTSRAVTIPQIAGGRIWFCRDNQLRFLLNPGPALVEPSVTNPSDPNYSFYWSFAEFTFNTSQLFANISYVDFVSLPISLALKSATAGVANQVVTGMSPSGLDTVCANLVAQNARDGAGWDKLIVKSPSSPSSSNLRALSPNAGIVMDNALFAGYYQPYVDAVWAKYASSPLTVDTQAQWGVLQAQVSPATKLLTFPDAGAFPQPSSADIFSCSTGAFAWYPGPNGDVMGNITARLAAAFNRSTLLVNADQPAGETVASYYKDGAVATNHYARIVHAANADGKGYAFPYDDVAPEERLGVAGTVSDGNPGVFAVAVGGGVAVVDGGVPCCLLRVLG